MENPKELNKQDVELWRKEQRRILIERRLAMSGETRTDWTARIAAGLLADLAAKPPSLLGFYWPFKGEYDPRPVVQQLHEKGVALALPVVVEKAAPLIFRPWFPGARLIAGVWNIPVPAEGDAVLPDTLLVPLVGYDRQNFRLGYGGGFYDRTLAAMPHRARTVGMGFGLGSLDTIYPQSYDIPMDVIITEGPS